jgi:hypothetical protein
MLHETSPDAIPLPLRYLIASAVRTELRDFDDGEPPARAKPGIPGYGTLAGYAYAATGPTGKERCELTPFGTGLRALLGVPAEGSGG